MVFLASAVLAVVLSVAVSAGFPTSAECTSGHGGFSRGSLRRRSLRSGGIRRGTGSLCNVLVQVLLATVMLAVVTAPTPAVLSPCSDRIGKFAGNLFESLGILEFANIIFDRLLTSLEFHVGIAGKERVGLFEIISKNTGRPNDNSGEERDGRRETHSDKA